MARIAIHKSSGNVYKDLGFRDAEEMQAKAALVSRLMSIIKKKKWTQKKAAEFLGVPQPRISLLSRGHFAGFSLEKLFKLLNKLNQDIKIIVKNSHSSKRNYSGHVGVTYL